MGDTKTTLVNDLLAKSASKERDVIIHRAKRGVYHDFETQLATPKMQLREDLLEAGFEDLAKKVVNGDYDDESPLRRKR